MDTRKLLEELENVINSANEVPFTNKKMVDKDEIERLIDAINQSLPNIASLYKTTKVIEVKNSQTSLESLGITSSQAWKVGSQENDTWNIQKMDTPLGSITEESELVKQAQERANEVISSANKSAEELRTSSVTYATDVLKYVETNMENVLDSLKKNRQSLIDSNSAAARQQQERAEDNGNKK